MIRLKELRNKSNLSQTALSNILGIPKGSISQWENGVREMSYDTLVKFADFYGCSCLLYASDAADDRRLV